MATHGKEGRVFIGAAQVAEVTEFDYDDGIELEDATNKALTDEAFTAGYRKGVVRIKCNHDPGDATGQQLMVPGAEVSLALYPEGKTPGNVQYTGDVVIENRKFSSPLRGNNSMEFTGRGVLTEGTVAGT